MTSDAVRPPRVAAVQVEPRYPTAVPYHPSEAYPEYPFLGCLAAEPNAAYRGVREALATLGLDGARFGTAAWNPLGHLIEPGMTVVLKPNWVLSRHKHRKDLYALITHPSVLRAVADYAWIALRGRGRILIVDVPQYDCNFAELVAATRIDQTVAFYAGHAGPTVSFGDYRRYWSAGKHFASQLQANRGDPEGSLLVDLGVESALYGKSHGDQLYGAVYNRAETIARHHGATQQYEVSATIMKADVVISVPKLKVHKKVGVTLNAKGLVGINTNKNFLVHYTLAPPSRGGDQYPDGLFTPIEELLIRTERWMYDHLLAPRHRLLEYLHRSVYAIHNATTKRLGLKVAEWKRIMDAGNWYGNDSAWRMTADLVKVFWFADREGILRQTPQRRTFSVVDGIVGGDLEGPLAADPVAAGTVVAGENLLAVDLVATRLMGFDPLKVRTFTALLGDPGYDFGVRSLDQIEVASPVPGWAGCLADRSSPFLGFRPHPGWVGHLEVQPTGAPMFASSLSNGR